MGVALEGSAHQLTALMHVSYIMCNICARRTPPLPQHLRIISGPVLCFRLIEGYLLLQVHLRSGKPPVVVVCRKWKTVMWMICLRDPRSDLFQGYRTMQNARRPVPARPVTTSQDIGKNSGRAGQPELGSLAR